MRFININTSLLRALVVVVGVATIVAGVTFAALQSQQVALAGNSIQTASANLLIGTASPTSTAYSNSHSGFSFTNIVPGSATQPASTNTFYLKNSGTATLKLKLNVGSTPTNTSTVDLSKVHVFITRSDTNVTQSATLQSLLDSSPSGGLALTDTLAPAPTGYTYTIGVTMDDDAFSGSSATIGSIDFVFSGTAVQ